MELLRLEDYEIIQLDPGNEKEGHLHTYLIQTC